MGILLRKTSKTFLATTHLATYDNLTIARKARVSQLSVRKDLFPRKKSKLITEDYFVQHMSTTINKVLLNRKLYTKDNEGNSLIKHGSLIDGYSLHKFNLQSSSLR